MPFLPPPPPGSAETMMEDLAQLIGWKMGRGARTLEVMGRQLHWETYEPPEEELFVIIPKTVSVLTVDKAVEMRQEKAARIIREMDDPNSLIVRINDLMEG